MAVTPCIRSAAITLVLCATTVLLHGCGSGDGKSEDKPTEVVTTSAPPVVKEKVLSHKWECALSDPGKVASYSLQISADELANKKPKKGIRIPTPPFELLPFEGEFYFSYFPLGAANAPDGRSSLFLHSSSDIVADMKLSANGHSKAKPLTKISDTTPGGVLDLGPAQTEGPVDLKVELNDHIDVNNIQDPIPAIITLKDYEDGNLKKKTTYTCSRNEYSDRPEDRMQHREIRYLGNEPCTEAKKQAVVTEWFEFDTETEGTPEADDFKCEGNDVIITVTREKKCDAKYGFDEKKAKHCALAKSLIQTRRLRKRARTDIKKQIDVAQTA